MKVAHRAAFAESQSRIACTTSLDLRVIVDAAVEQETDTPHDFPERQFFDDRDVEKSVIEDSPGTDSHPGAVVLAVSDGNIRDPHIVPLAVVHWRVSANTMFPNSRSRNALFVSAE